VDEPTGKSRGITDHPRAAAPGRRGRLGRPRLLIVGCGDIGRRIVSHLGRRWRVFGAVREAASAQAVRRAGAIPLTVDLDDRSSLARLARLAKRVIVLAPTSGGGLRDLRSQHLLAALSGHGRMVYLSTSGVYGDRRGAWTDETAPARPRNDRAARRLDAERRLRASAWHAAVLRVPGIYGPGRLPLQRLRERIPAPLPQDDVITNHVHADDLARAAIAALFRGAPARVYNAVDDSCMALGEYLDRVADVAGLPRPPRMAREPLREAAGALRMSFMEESRRLRNARLKRELKFRLRYPDVEAGLAAMRDAAPAGGGSRA
jgi:nucleoside-diphosphate-sugar epimerase